jgi:hypothetical protein
MYLEQIGTVEKAKSFNRKGLFNSPQGGVLANKRKEKKEKTKVLNIFVFQLNQLWQNIQE